MAGDDDGDWEVANPVDPTTGLWYDAGSHSSSEADWADLVPTFLRHGYDKSLGLKDQTEHPLLLVERSYNPPPLRQQLLEILMEECQVPATFFGRDAAMACYSCGRTTSTVIDIGYNGTTVTPVYEGYVEQKGIRRSPIGTLAMDDFALDQLKNICSASKTKLKPVYQVRNPQWETRKDPFHRLALLQIARECRESGAGQSINTAVSKTLLVPSISYTLPDGKAVDIPSQNRFAVADLALAPAKEDEAAPKPRVEALENLKKKYETVLATATQPDEEEKGSDEDEDAMDTEEKKTQSEKFSQAAAVGVSSRRTTRGSTRSATKTNSKNAKTEPKTPKVKFDNRTLQRACSSYLQNHVEQLTSAPIANMVCDAAFRCDRDQQASMLGNVVLCGGGGCIGPTDQAVPDMLREQIEAIIHSHTPGWRVKMLSPSIQERAICSWLGGSILASLGTFHEMWITKAEYEEWGSAIVNRKCP